MRVLLLEDEKKINDMLALYLRQDGHHVDGFLTAEDALKAFERADYDVVITDLMLPGLQGDAFVKKIRETSHVYVMVLTAKTGDLTKLSLLGEGADDYITKPFSIDEIQLKLRNLEKRLMKSTVLQFRFHDRVYRLDVVALEVRCDGVVIPLNSTEVRLVEYFMRHPQHVLTREQIIEGCLDDSEAYDRIVDTYVKNLRKKLKDKAIIETVYGAGYRFLGERYA